MLLSSFILTVGTFGGLGAALPASTMGQGKQGILRSFGSNECVDSVLRRYPEPMRARDVPADDEATVYAWALAENQQKAREVAADDEATVYAWALAEKEDA